MNWHKMDVNTSKTHFVGRDIFGEMSHLRLEYEHPDGKITVIEPIGLDRSVRYLGIKLNMNLDWTDQANSMTQSIVGTLSKFHPENFTVMTACMTVRSVLIPRLIIGMQHAYIPPTKLKWWDTMLMRGIQRCLGTKHTLSPAVLPALCNTDTISAAYRTQQIYGLILRLNDKSHGVSIFRKLITIFIRYV